MADVETKSGKWEAVLRYGRSSLVFTHGLKLALMPSDRPDYCVDDTFPFAVFSDQIPITAGYYRPRTGMFLT